MGNINLKKIINSSLKPFTVKIFYLNERTLDYVRIKTGYNLLIICGIFFIGYLFGFMGGETYIETRYGLNTRDEVYPIKDGVWMDSVFTDYRVKADKYLKRSIFTGTPLTGSLLSTCARNSYEKTGVLVPVELVLAQAQFESSMGREGRSPKTNPFNIGEWDEKTVKWFNNTFEGTQEYFTLMTNKYLKCKDVNELLFNFTNCSGKRYASGEYEIHISKQYHYIRNWLEKNKR